VQVNLGGIRVTFSIILVTLAWIQATFQVILATSPVTQETNNPTTRTCVFQ
jgi:hypothetical protein